MYRAGQAPAHLATRNQLRRDGAARRGCTGLNQERADYAVQLAVVNVAGDVLLDDALAGRRLVTWNASFDIGILDNELAAPAASAGPSPPAPGGPRSAPWSSTPRGTATGTPADRTTPGSPRHASGDCRAVIDRLHHMA